MSLLRDTFYAVGLTVTSPIWAISMLRSGKWRTDWAGRFGRGEKLPAPESLDLPKRSRLVIHAVSVGEVNATRTLTAWFAEHRPEVDVVISVATNTGTARAETLYGDTHSIVRFPLDFTGSVRRFLDRVQPDAVALMELEVWPGLVSACVNREIPIGVVNGRLSARSFKGYARFRGVIGGSFRALSFAAVQTPDYQQRFLAMGVRGDRVHVMDTMKWDTATDREDPAKMEALVEHLGVDRNRPIVVLGSAAPGEEAMLAEGIRQWPDGTQLIVAPRKPEWFDGAATAMPGCVRRSGSGATSTTNATSKATSDATTRATKSAISPPSLFLLDTIGELRAAYAMADVCVVGRSFTGTLHGSDPMEPAALGKPTLIGPTYDDFTDQVEALTAGGGMIVTADPVNDVDCLLRDSSAAARLAEAGRTVVAQRRGATARTAALLERFLPSL